MVERARWSRAAHLIATREQRDEVEKVLGKIYPSKVHSE
jgi:hypothetical protein